MTGAHVKSAAVVHNIGQPSRTEDHTSSVDSLGCEPETSEGELKVNGDRSIQTSRALVPPGQCQGQGAVLARPRFWSPVTHDQGHPFIKHLWKIADPRSGPDSYVKAQAIIKDLAKAAEQRAMEPSAELTPARRGSARAVGGSGPF